MQILYYKNLEPYSSRGLHEKNGNQILHTTKHPKICFVWEKQTEMHF